MWVSFLTQGAQRILGTGVVRRNRVNCSSLMSTLCPPPCILFELSYLNIPVAGEMLTFNGIRNMSQHNYAVHLGYNSFLQISYFAEKNNKEMVL